MDSVTLEQINEGNKHILIHMDPNRLECTFCKEIYDYSALVNIPEWALVGLVWGFANKHHDCKKKMLYAPMHY